MRHDIDQHWETNKWLFSLISSSETIYIRYQAVGEQQWKTTNCNHKTNNESRQQFCGDYINDNYNHAPKIFVFGNMIQRIMEYNIVLYLDAADDMDKEDTQ